MKKYLFIVFSTVLFCTVCNAQSSHPSKWSDKKVKEWFESGKFLNGLPMIADPSIDKRTFAIHYYDHKETWDKAFAFLKNTDLSTLALGKIELGGGMYATVSEYDTKDRESTLFEAHKKYIDIQYIIKGKELMDVEPLKNMTVTKPYNEANDAMFGTVAKFKELKAMPGRFFLFFPTDAHRPSMKDGNSLQVRKIVVKVPV